MNNLQYSAFLKDVENKLLKGDSVICFRKYQLDVLIKIYKDNLIYQYNENNQWWSCRLKNPCIEYPRMKSRNDITKEQVTELYNQGHTLKYISDKLGCSTYLVRQRLELK